MPRPHTPPGIPRGQRRKRLLIPQAGEVLPYLARCHISTATPSLAVTHPCRKKPSSHPLQDKHPFVRGESTYRPFGCTHATPGRLTAGNLPPSTHLALKFNAVKKSV